MTTNFEYVRKSLIVLPGLIPFPLVLLFAHDVKAGCYDIKIFIDSH